MTHGGEDNIDGKVTAVPADGPNSEYDTVKDGELRINFERLNDEAIPTVTRFDTTNKKYLQRKPNIYNHGTTNHAL